MAFKQDEDFLRFITMGAAASAEVSRHMREAHGHRTVELERYAMANKIWATKIKRLRLADLVCLDCGLRIEARAKSDLRVRMSHSNAEGRGWDAGLRDQDLCAFVPWSGGAPAGKPEYFTVGAMRDAADNARFGPPKAASEGAERDMTWPTRVASRDSVVESIDWDEGKVRVRPFDGKRQTVQLPGDVPRFIYVDESDELRGRATFVMGCLDRPAALDCPGGTWDHGADLGSDDDIDCYVAVKAAGLRGGKAVEPMLLDIASDENQDARIRLEACGSLARLDPATYTSTVVRRAEERTEGDRQSMAIAMEAIFVLSELGTEEAAQALRTLAEDRALDSEARCACVWGLGVAGVDDSALVLPFIADEDQDVALHALAGIGEVPPEMLPQVVEMLGGTDEDAASASALLAMQGDAGTQILLATAMAEGRGTSWTIAALGEVSETDVRRVSGGELPGGLERALAPMWTQSRSWLRRRRLDTPLEFLQRQTIRHLG